MRRQPPGTTSASPVSQGGWRFRRHARELPQKQTALTSAANRAVQRTSSAIPRSDHDSNAKDVQEDFNESTSSQGTSQPSSLYSTMEVEEFASPGQQKRVFSVNLDAPTLLMGRILVLVASLIYGTNFAIVKMLDDTLPLSISATLRFGLAAAVVAALVLSKEDENVEAIVVKERNLAMSSGLEIGMWYCIGYICQAEGLQSVTAGKVSTAHVHAITPELSRHDSSTIGEPHKAHKIAHSITHPSPCNHHQSAFYNALAVVVVPILDALFKSKA